MIQHTLTINACVVDDLIYYSCIIRTESEAKHYLECSFCPIQKGFMKASPFSRNLDEPLLIEVFDWDSEKKSDFIGQCEVRGVTMNYTIIIVLFLVVNIDILQISINDLVKSSGKEVKLHHKPGK